VKVNAVTAGIVSSGLNLLDLQEYLLLEASHGREGSRLLLQYTPGVRGNQPQLELCRMHAPGPFLFVADALNAYARPLHARHFIKAFLAFLVNLICFLSDSSLFELIDLSLVSSTQNIKDGKCMGM
jgi:hypothetical protein